MAKATATTSVALLCKSEASERAGSAIIVCKMVDGIIISPTELEKEEEEEEEEEDVDD